ncbi:prohibitin-like protein, putative [Hepatocystis sp. ex Piliocolobus tephrosceles]|nr:prohibitin-like protein, putative [Hepatocystis sp. ex Piliocolobus tephrosceles]
MKKLILILNLNGNYTKLKKNSLNNIHTLVQNRNIKNYNEKKKLNIIFYKQKKNKIDLGMSQTNLHNNKDIKINNQNGNIRNKSGTYISNNYEHIINDKNDYKSIETNVKNVKKSYDSDGDGDVVSHSNKVIEKKIKLKNIKNFNLLVICLISSFFFYFTLKKVPQGYICLIQNKKNKIVVPYIYDDLMTFFYNPFKYEVIHMRIIPIQKKYENIYQTLNNKKVKVCLQVKMKPKVPFIIDIFSSFGANYSTNYIKREMDLDIKHVVKKYNLETLIDQYSNGNKSSENRNTKITVDDVIDELIDRFYDCSVFYKIILMDVSISFEKVD